MTVCWKEAPFLQLRRSVTKTNCLHSHSHVLGSPSAQASKYHRILLMCIFSPQSSDLRLFSTKNKLTGCQFKQKSKLAGWIPICSSRPAVPQWDPRRCVNVCVVRRGEGVNCSCTPLRCAPVSVSVRAGQAPPYWSASCVFNCTSGCHLVFHCNLSIVSPNTSYLLPCQYPPLCPTLRCALRRLI